LPLSEVTRDQAYTDVWCASFLGGFELGEQLRQRFGLQIQREGPKAPEGKNQEASDETDQERLRQWYVCQMAMRRILY
jgi:hypothetical protein